MSVMPLRFLQIFYLHASLRRSSSRHACPTIIIVPTHTWPALLKFLLLFVLHVHVD
jgi:hypothetical protein